MAFFFITLLWFSFLFWLLSLSLSGSWLSFGIAR